MKKKLMQLTEILGGIIITFRNVSGGYRCNQTGEKVTRSQTQNYAYQFFQRLRPHPLTPKVKAEKIKISRIYQLGYFYNHVNCPHCGKSNSISVNLELPYIQSCQSCTKTFAVHPHQEKRH